MEQFKSFGDSSRVICVSIRVILSKIEWLESLKNVTQVPLDPSLITAKFCFELIFGNTVLSFFFLPTDAHNHAAKITAGDI